MNFTAFSALVRRDLRLFFTDRRAMVMSFVAPILIASFFGYIFGGVTNEVAASKIRVAAVDRDGTGISRKLVAALSGDKSLAVTDEPLDRARAEVRVGHTVVAVVIPKGFEEQAARAFLRGLDKPEIQLLYDPSHGPELAMVNGMLTQHVMEVVSSEVSAGGFSMPYTVKQEAMTSRRGQVYNGMAHAFAGMSVQFILFMGIDAGLAVLAQRRSGIWTRLRAAPISRFTIIGSRAASAGAIAMIILGVVFSFARLVFHVRIEGSMPGFLLVCAAFSIMTAAFGLLIAVLGKTPEATRGLAILVTLILVMLGGSWVPAFLFPQWLQSASFAVPTRWAVDGLDGMIWRGLGFNAALAPAAAMLGFAALFGGVAIWRFRWDTPE